jgi:hypothetical protein
MNQSNHNINHDCNNNSSDDNYHTINSVTCQSCGKHYTQSVISESQAWRCASDVYMLKGKDYILSHYGSEHDTEHYILAENHGLEHGVVCDECIDKAIATQVASLDSHFNYFDNYQPSLEKELPEYIECETCHTHYYQVFGSTQAYDCAADVNLKNQDIYAHYGSDYDSERYVIKKAGILNTGIVCDSCLKDAIEKQAIEKDEAFSYWETWQVMFPALPDDLEEIKEF